MSNHEEFNIFNRSNCAVSVIDTDADESQTKVWIKGGTFEQSWEGINKSDISFIGDGLNSGVYVESGSEVLLSPVDT